MKFKSIPMFTKQLSDQDLKETNGIFVSEVQKSRMG